MYTAARPRVKHTSFRCCALNGTVRVRMNIHCSCLLSELDHFEWWPNWSKKWPILAPACALVGQISDTFFHVWNVNKITNKISLISFTVGNSWNIHWWTMISMLGLSDRMQNPLEMNDLLKQHFDRIVNEGEVDQCNHHLVANTRYVTRMRLCVPWWCTHTLFRIVNECFLLLLWFQLEFGCYYGIPNDGRPPKLMMNENRLSCSNKAQFMTPNGLVKQHCICS